MNRSIAPVLALSCLASAAFAQSGFVGQGNTKMLLIDPTGSGKATAYDWSATGTDAGGSRGHVIGHDGRLYRSAWKINGIVVNDWQSTTPTVANLVFDTTNRVMGGPYQPVLDLNHKGGPGIACVDGNPAPAPAPNGFRNWFTVDINAPSFAVDGYFRTADVPMSDCFRNPFNSKQFVTVGFSTTDPKVSTWELPGGSSLFTASTVVSLSNPCQYDAMIHEDQKLYCWTSVANGPIGFQVVDLKTGFQAFQSISNISHIGAGYACVWNEPFEKPGRIAYVLQDSTTAAVAEKLYRVDLLTGKATLIPLKIPPGTYSTGRSIEESQLISWKDATKKTKRRFHINFGKVKSGDTYILFPTLAGYGPKVTIHGQELYLIPDFASSLAASNKLGAKTVGVYSSTSGQVDIDIDLGVELGADVVWAAARLSAGKVVDISNYIIVRM
jgi:hypothetical protein